MPVTEMATLRLNPPYAWESQTIQSFFDDVATEQAAWSGYPLHYFRDTTDPTVVYILTGWDSVPAHYTWIRSEQNQKLLERGKGLVEVVGLQHAKFEAKVQGEQVIVWEQWQRGREDAESGVDGEVGTVEEAPGEVRRIKGYSQGQLEGVAKEGQDDGRKRLLMQRLSLQRA